MQSDAKRCECGQIDLESATSERSFGSHLYPELARDSAPVCNFALRGGGNRSLRKARALSRGLVNRMTVKFKRSMCCPDRVRPLELVILVVILGIGLWGDSMRLGAKVIPRAT